MVASGARLVAVDGMKITVELDTIEELVAVVAVIRNEPDVVAALHSMTGQLTASSERLAAALIPTPHSQGDT